MRAGVSLKAQHYRMVIDRQPDVGWFEVHPENYMGAGGPPLGYLERIRRDYPLSLHSVGTSLGSHLPLDRDHLAALKELVDRFEPGMVSEHLSWSHGREWYTHDLLPLRYTEDALNLVVAHIDQVQEVLQRKILIENPSTYLQFRDSEMKEQDFLAEAARRSGAGLLLDINNVYVSCCNHGWDIEAYLSAIPAQLVGEIHLAGHSVQALRKGTLRLDDHGSAVCDEVWNLYKDCIQTMGPVPTLIERDSNIPEFTALLGEAAIADQALTAAGEKYEAAV
jgi:hypothetical protein